MKMKKPFWGLLMGLTLLCSCDNTLEINADWRETPVVMAFIDLTQDSQIIRIQKTYQNSIDKTTAEVAQIADSLDMRNITVNIHNTGNPTLVKSFSRVSPRKEEGFFSNRDSSYWGAPSNGFFRSGQNYTLRIKSGETGNEYIATTQMIDTASIDFFPNIDLVNTTPPNFIYTVLSTGNNVYIFDYAIRMHYEESSVANPVQKTEKYIDFFIRRNQLLGSSNRLSISISKNNYRNFIQNQMKKDPTVARTFKRLEYVVIAANRDFADMIETNKPSSSVIPKVGEYSNITNGIGIFACRNITRRTQGLNQASIDLLNGSILNP